MPSIIESVLAHKTTYKSKRTLFTILMLGFMSGLPFLLTLSTLSYWLAEEGVNNTTIGLFMLVTLPYSFKFLWAPLFDYGQIPLLGSLLGKRKSWLFLMQIGLVLCLSAMSFTNPHLNIYYTALAALGVSFFSASQDILIDAYRIETVLCQERGMAAALETIGFRFGMLASGAGALYLASMFSWKIAYLTMAEVVAFCLLLTLCIQEPETAPVLTPKEPQPSKSPGQYFKQFYYFIRPLQEFAHHDKIVYIFLFIFCFKLADTVMNAMSAPFLCSIGFSKLEFATVSKLFGISLMVLGGLGGGFLVHRMGTYSAAIMCAVLQSFSCLMFCIQAIVGYDCSVLVITIGVESFCSGMTSAIFIVFLSEFCSTPHTATHFTVLYCVGSFSRVLTSAGAGWLADHVDWQFLFVGTSLIVFPTLYSLNRLIQFKNQPQAISPRKLV